MTLTSGMFDFGKNVTLAICAFLISSTLALPNGHLEGTVKYKDGERYAGCVYGEHGTAVLQWSKEVVTTGGIKDEPIDRIVECGSGWEGAFLYMAEIRPVMSPDESLWDLQKAYNCCVHYREGRAKFCESPRDGKGSAWDITWGECADYFGTMLGNVANVLPVVQQPEANEAVMMACIRAISGSEKFDNDESWMTDKKYNNRYDLLYDDCFKEEFLSKAAPYVFDYLRDHTGCLWNSPNDPFCSGSRRKFPGKKFGWEYK